MSELAQAIEEMRNMRESYDQLAATADLYQQGREALASAITAKGVPTTADTPLAEMAENVGDIQQVTTTIDGGDMYATQLFGDGVLWNLYDVLAQMKSQWLGAGHYAALIVCEYYKGYDSLQLQGADAYYTCDGDFYDTSSPLHVWHDSDNGRANRWVCFLFATAGARLDITNTAISPRSMYIGGHIGTIEYFVNGRLTNLVCGVEDTDTIDLFKDSEFSQAFGLNVISKNIKDFGKLKIVSYGAVIIKNLSNLNKTNADYLISAQYANYVNIEFDSLYVSVNGSLVYSCGYLDGAEIKGKITGTSSGLVLYVGTNALDRPLRYIHAEGYLGGAILFGGGSGKFRNLIDVSVGEAKYNMDMRLWEPTNVLADATKKAQLIDNIKNHILARVSDATGGTQLVFSVSTNMYNEIATENIEWQGDTMSLADAFLTKNWLLAGA